MYQPRLTSIVMFVRRETGSVVVPAEPERVFALLRDRMDARALVSVSGTTRLDIVRGHDRSTFVLRGVPGGTQVVSSRSELGLRGLFESQERLREAVEADLFRIRQLVDGP